MNLDELRNLDTPEALMREAARLDERAEDLRREARALGHEAYHLRRRAELLQEAPTPPKPVTPAPDPRLDGLNGHRELAERVLTVLGGVTERVPISVVHTIVGERVVTTEALRNLLRELVERGLVVRTGVKRGTRYHLADHQELSTTTFGDSYETAVRDAARKLGVFAFPDIVAELPGLTEATVRRWVKTWEDRGVLVSERVGNAKMWEYAAPEPGKAPARRQEPTPEELARRSAGPMPVRGVVVDGTGQGRRAGVPIVDELLREVRKVAPDVQVEKAAHSILFKRDGRVLSNCSRTPGGTSLKDTRRRLRDAGVPVKP